MKQIFDLIKTKVNKIADIQNCGEEDCYPWKKEECRGCANRRVSVKAVLKLINEAEAKCEQDCCEWKPYGKKEFIENPHTKRMFSNEPSMKNVYCNTCGKPIKISEVE